MTIFREVKIGICDELADAQALYGRMLLSSAITQSVSDENAVERGGDLLEARTLLEYALRMYRKIYGDLHSNIGTTLLNMGEIHIELEEYEESLVYLDDALVVLGEFCGLDSLELADCHNRAGSVLQALNVLEEASEAYKEAIRIYIYCIVVVVLAVVERMGMLQNLLIIMLHYVMNRVNMMRH